MSPSSSDKFFDESQEQSVVKATIVEKYFVAWAKIIIATQKRFPRRTQKLGYVDLFAGPGRYKDGSISTPLRILNRALDDPEISERLVTILNDKNEDHSSSLLSAIGELENISRLKNSPIVWNEEVGEDIAKQFEEIITIPLFAFIDPWGYKGLSLRLVDAFLKDWGCDCIFFFNYSRINAGLSNPLVKQHMEALFGDEAEALSARLNGMSSQERETTIVESLAQVLKSFGHRYVLPFCFKNQSGKRTTHHLIFVSKAFKGYEVMKEVMAKESSKENQGVPSFEFVPPSSAEQKLLFELNRPLDELEQLLLSSFRGRTLTMKEIYEQHCVDTPYISRNYKEVLKKMEDESRISTTGRRSNRGFADYIQVTFPD